MKRVPAYLAIGFSVVTAVASGVWYAATMVDQLNNVSTRVDRIEVSIAEILKGEAEDKIWNQWIEKLIEERLQ